jgi:hypothetical protein
VSQAIRKEYIDKEKAIMDTIKRYEGSFEPKEFASMIKYMDEFFATFKSDAKFKANITDKCRTN